MKKYIYAFSVLATSVAFTGCAGLDTESEGRYVTEGQITETNAAISTRSESALVGMYNYLGKSYAARPNSTRADDGGYPTICIQQDSNGADMVCDNSGYNWFSAAADLTDRNYTYASCFERYAVFYNQIKYANDLIATIDPATTDKASLQVLGQAKAVRAFDYLSLVPYYQFNYQISADKPCVPIVTEATTDFGHNPRATVKEVYEQIMNDLNSAIELLADFDRNGDNTRVNKNVAYGLRARANLYMGKYAEAAADAEKALEGYTPYTREEVSAPSFYNRADHNWIWAIDIDKNTVKAYPTSDSQLGSFSSNGYAAACGVYKRINTLLYNKIPASDVRKGWWVDEKLHSDNLKDAVWVNTTTNERITGDAIATYTFSDKVKFLPYTNVKFGMYSCIGSSTNDSDWPLMRAEEMILIKAEGLAMSGKIAEGKAVLEDFVKTYRDPEYSCKAASAEDMQNEVWFQRRVELWGEGFSMSDIMRLNKPIVRFHGTNTENWPDAFCFNVAAGDAWLLLRIPQNEINANSSIVQNEGGEAPKSMQNPNLTDGVTD